MSICPLFPDGVVLLHNSDAVLNPIHPGDSCRKAYRLDADQVESICEFGHHTTTPHANTTSQISIKGSKKIQQGEGRLSGSTAAPLHSSTALQVQCTKPQQHSSATSLSKCMDAARLSSPLHESRECGAQAACMAFWSSPVPQEASTAAVGSCRHANSAERSQWSPRKLACGQRNQ